MTDIADEDIRALADEAVVAKFFRLREQNADPNIRTCENCGTSQPGQPEQKKMECVAPSCDHVFCYEHGDACQVRDGLACAAS